MIDRNKFNFAKFEYLETRFQNKNLIFCNHSNLDQQIKLILKNVYEYIEYIQRYQVTKIVYF